ncbi:MAG TPA: hypothetical protein VM198_07400 [Longimicrobiales bacterium]|nr:hypothetical protein [Longimicrobiales bacterium]
MTTRSWFTAGLLLLVGILLVQTLALTPASRLAPVWVLVPTAVLLLLQLLVDVSPRLGERLRILQGAMLVPAARSLSADTEPTHVSLPTRDRRNRELRVVVWIAWLITLMYLVGFLLATALFLLPYLRMESRIGWGRSAVLTAAAAGAIYVAFGVVARVTFPAGVLF